MSPKILLALVCLGSTAVISLATVTTAYAQNGAKDKEKALDAYRKGTTEYNLGRWKAAITLFEKAYSLYPDAAFLFNIAQSYRQADDCKQAAFFYKRYLSINTSAPNQKEVEGYIRDLDETCRLRGQSNLSPPDTNLDPNKPKPDTNLDTDKPKPDPVKSDPNKTNPDKSGVKSSGGELTTGIPPVTKAEGAEPSVLVAYGYLGPSKNTSEGGDVKNTARLNATIAAGYPLKVGSVHLDVGALLSFVPYNWETPPNDGVVGFTTLMANVGARFEVFDKLMIRGELGLGPMFVTGLGTENNPFTEGGMTFTGPIAVFAARLAFGVEYALTDSLAISVEPLVLQIAGSKEGLVVGRLNSALSLFGVRYSM